MTGPQPPSAAQRRVPRCACGKPGSHLWADPDSPDWACRIPNSEGTRMVDQPNDTPDLLMTTTVYTCSECEKPAVAEHWHTASALALRHLDRQIERGEIDADDVWRDTEMMVCPRCKFEHHDNESSWVDETRAAVGAVDV